VKLSGVGQFRFERAARPIHRILARRFYMNPEQEITLKAGIAEGKARNHIPS
jgi:hypothetical protein